MASLKVYTKNQKDKIDICVCTKGYCFPEPWKLEIFVDDPEHKTVASIMDEIADLLGIHNMWRSDQELVRAWIIYESVISTLSLPVKNNWYWINHA